MLKLPIWVPVFHSLVLDLLIFFLCNTFEIKCLQNAPPPPPKKKIKKEKKKKWLSCALNHSESGSKYKQKLITGWNV